MNLNLSFVGLPSGAEEAFYKKYAIDLNADSSAVEDYTIGVVENKLYFALSGKWIHSITMLPGTARRFKIERIPQFYSDFTNVKAKYLVSSLEVPTEEEELTALEGSIAFVGSTPEKAEIFMFFGGKWNAFCRVANIEGSGGSTPVEPIPPEQDGYLKKSEIVILIDNMLEEGNYCVADPEVVADLNVRINTCINELKAFVG